MRVKILNKAKDLCPDQVRVLHGGHQPLTENSNRSVAFTSGSLAHVSGQRRFGPVADFITTDCSAVR
jgi:hypothetical protein